MSDTPTPEIELRFPKADAASRLVRAALRGILRSADGELAADAELVVSELVSNVVRHTDHGGVFRAWHTPTGLHLEVVDDNDDLPATPPPAPETYTGRGLLIVNEVASAWGAEPLHGGKAIWAEMQSRRSYPGLPDATS